MKQLSIRDCVRVTAQAFKIHPDSLLGSRRRNGVTIPRHCAFLLARENGHSLSDVGDYFGVDHSSVHQGAARAKERRDAVMKENGWAQ